MYKILIITIMFPLTSYASLYGGIEGGGSRFNDSCQDSNLECNNISSTYGLYAGYDISSWLSLETNIIKYNEVSSIYGDYKYKAKAHALDLSAIASYDVADKWSVFGRIGSSYNFINKTINSSANTEKKVDSEQFSLLVGVGGAYDLSQSWSVRSEFRYIDSVGNDEVGTANLSTIFLGLTYEFGDFSKKTESVKNNEFTAPLEDTNETINNNNVLPYDDSIGKVSVFNVKDEKIKLDIESNKNEPSNGNRIEIPNPYIVQKGDWLSKLRRKYSFDLDVIIEKNNIDNVDLIYPGQILITK